MKIVCLLLKLVLKILLLPVAFLLRFLCFIGNLLMQLSLWVLSPIMLFVLGCGIYSVVRASWTDVFLSLIHILPELMNMFKEVADIKTSDQLHLPVPEAKFETVVRCV